MGAKEAIKQALLDIFKECHILGDAPFAVGNVVAGSVSGNYCDVQPLDGALIKKVRLNAFKDKTGILITPADDSFVVVGMLSNTDAYIAMFSEIAKIEVAFSDENTVISVEDETVKYKDGKKLEVEIADGKVKVKKDSVSFKDEMDTLLDTLSTAVIATPAGTGAFAADTVTKIKKVKTNLNQILC